MVISEVEFCNIADELSNSDNVRMGVIGLDEALSDYFRSDKVYVQDDSGYVRTVKFEY